VTDGVRTLELLEVMRAIAGEIGAGRTGIRLSPVTPANDAAQDSDAQGLFNHLMGQLAPMKLAFMHVIEGSTGGPRDFAPFDYEALHAIYKQAHPQGVWMLNNGYDRAMAIEAVASGIADAVAFGKPFISNPDLVRRLREDAPLNALDAATMFGGDAKGYIDYPTLDAVS
jgi:N-ethylmaleimide reductase